jgi:hypothetical protein
VRQPISARTAAGTPATDPVVSPIGVQVSSFLQPALIGDFVITSQVAGGAKAKSRSPRPFE